MTPPRRRCPEGHDMVHVEGYPDNLGCVCPVCFPATALRLKVAT